jgi:inorganic pyrophosphatase
MRNDRLLGVAQASHLYANVQAIGDLPQGVVDELIAFWTQENALRGETFQAVGLSGAEDACALIAAAIVKP